MIKEAAKVGVIDISSFYERLSGLLGIKTEKLSFIDYFLSKKDFSIGNSFISIPFLYIFRRLKV
jgi:hypothetical protein